VVHPRQSIERQVKRRFRGVCRAMHEQKNSFRLELSHPVRTLIADVELNSGMACRYVVALRQNSRCLGVHDCRKQGNERDYAGSEQTAHGPLLVRTLRETAWKISQIAVGRPL